MDDGVKVDGLPLQLVTSQHRPMPLDDLRGLDALCRMSLRISFIVSDGT